MIDPATMIDKHPDRPTDVRISVLMPVYNAERYLAEALDSVLRQTLPADEIVIVDDGSSDGSLSILERYAQFNPAIRLFSRSNTGLVRALNEGLSHCRGEYIARMDADDISLPERFERQADYLDQHPACVAVGCLVERIDEDGDKLGPFSFQPLDHDSIDAVHIKNKEGVGLMHPAVLMRRDALIKLGGYRDFVPGEDRDLWLRMAEIGILSNLPEVLFLYRCHYHSYTMTYCNALADKGTPLIVEAYRRRGMREPETSSGMSRPKKPTIIDYEMSNAWHALYAGHYRTARKYARRTLRARPFSSAAWRLLLRSHLGPVGCRLAATTRVFAKSTRNSEH